MTQPQTWELLVLGGTVLTLEAGSEPIRDGAVAIAGGRIVAVGPAESLLELAPTGEVLNAAGCLILPGLVNTHSHLGMTVMRGMADDLTLTDWLENHIWPTERNHMNRELVAVGTRLAAAEQLLAGITTTTDMYFFGDEVAAALTEAGIRGVVSEAVIDFGTPSCTTPEEMLARQRELIEQYRKHPTIVPSVAAHAPYTVSAANLVKEAELAEEFAVPLQIHLSETAWEVEKVLEEKGVSPIAYLADLGVLSERTVADHCVHISEEDMDILAEFDVGVSHNPVSNLKLAAGVAPVPKLLARGVRVGLGTDSAGSNNTLDLLGDMRLAAILHKGVNGDPTVLPARKVLEMATVDGASVLGLSHRVGQLKEGYDADLVCISVEEAHATPLYDPFSHLVYAARAHDVRHVLVRGKTVVRNRTLETLDLAEVISQARRAGDRIKG